MVKELGANLLYYRVVFATQGMSFLFAEQLLTCVLDFISFEYV